MIPTYLIMQAIPSAPAVSPDSATQWTGLGLVVVVALWLIGYAGPKIIKAVENISPTIAAELKAQEASHIEDRKATEARHALERKDLLDMVKQHSITTQDSARATRAALGESTRHAG